MIDILENIVGSMNTILWSYILITLLIFAGLYFTLINKFVQFTMIGEMFRLMKDGISGNKEGISSFQAFCMSTASRVGTGNMAGVALAVAAGGPGAVFWMWLIAVIGAASAFVESTLAQIYKKTTGEKNYVGGPAYYMKKALKSRKLGVTFSVLITICFGFIFNAVQSNTISLAFDKAFGIPPLYMGIFLVILTASVIFGGVKRIATVTEKIVPIMAIAYVLVIGYVIIGHLTELPAILILIVKNAFGFEQLAGGTLGAALMQGIKRGLFSNEAGMGSAPNAAATAEVSHPVKQGLIQALGVFTDTLLICTSTAFLILLSKKYMGGNTDGIQLTQEALVSMVGNWGAIFIAVCIFLFAFSSIIGNYYYGESNVQFMSNNNKKALIIYRTLVLAMVIFGTLAKLQIIWDLADLFMGLMALLNIYAIIRLSPIVLLALKDYKEQKKQGIDPVFDPNKIGVKEGADSWKKYL